MINRRMVLIDRLNAVLAEAMTHRNEHQNEVATEYDPYPVPGWVVFERDAMYRAVTEERAKLGKPPITMDMLFRHERMACGHVDYQRKYAIYAAELILDESPLQRRA